MAGSESPAGKGRALRLGCCGVQQQPVQTLPRVIDRRSFMAPVS